MSDYISRKTAIEALQERSDAVARNTLYAMNMGTITEAEEAESRTIIETIAVDIEQLEIIDFFVGEHDKECVQVMSADEESSWCDTHNQPWSDCCN